MQAQMEIYVDNDPATFEAMSKLFEFYGPATFDRFVCKNDSSFA